MLTKINFLAAPVDPFPLEAVHVNLNSGDETDILVHGIHKIHMSQIMARVREALVRYGYQDDPFGGLGVRDREDQFLTFKIGNRTKRLKPTIDEIEMLCPVLVALDEDQHEWTIHEVYAMYALDPEVFAAVVGKMNELGNRTEDDEKKASPTQVRLASPPNSATIQPLSTDGTNLPGKPLKSSKKSPAI